MGIFGILSRGHYLHGGDMLGEVGQLTLGKVNKLFGIFLLFALPITLCKCVGGYGIYGHTVLALGGKLGRVVGGNEDEISVISLVVHACTQLYGSGVEIVHAVAIYQRGTQIFHRIVVNAQVEHKHRLHRTEGVEDVEIFLVKMLSAYHTLKEVLACATAYYHIRGDLAAVCKSDALHLARFNKHLVNDSAVMDLSTVGGNVVGKSLGYLLAATLYIAIAGVIFFTLLFKGNTLVKGSLKVGEHHSKTLCLRGIGAEVGKNTGKQRADLLRLKEVSGKLVCIHARIFLYFHKGEGEASLLYQAWLLSRDIAQMHYVVIEFVVSVNALGILGEQLLQPLATPIGALILLRSNHIVVGHNDISIGTHGIKVNTQLVKEIVNRLAGQHIADKQRTLLKLIAIVLKQGNDSARLGIFIINMHLVAVSCRQCTKGQTAKARTDNIYSHFVSFVSSLFFARSS